MGTSFYVNAKVEQPTVDVIVHTGKVAIIGDKEERLVLTAGEKGAYNKSNGQLSKEENRKINQTYHSNITIDNPDIYHCLLTATFEEQSLEIILDVLQETFDLIIEQKDGKILITGNGCE